MILQCNTTQVVKFADSHRRLKVTLYCRKEEFLNFILILLLVALIFNINIATFGREDQRPIQTMQRTFSDLKCTQKPTKIEDFVVFKRCTVLSNPTYAILLIACNIAVFGFARMQKNVTVHSLLHPVSGPLYLYSIQILFSSQTT